VSIATSRWRVWLGLCVLLPLPAFELARHAAIVSSVPRDEDYRAAAAFVRAQLQPRDLVTSAPGFIDPIVRMYLGDRMSLAMVGRSDDSAYERMWVLSIRDDLPSDVPRTAAALTRQFGAVRVLRYELGKSRVLFDFVNAWSGAQASFVRGDRESVCRMRGGGVPRGGGLGKPVLAPLRDRFECDPARPWLFIGPMVMEDLANTPRYCLWQHPQGDEPVRLRFHDVPLGDQLLFYGGVYYEHERMRQGGMIEATVSINGRERAKLQHRDGEGWKRLLVNTRDLAAQRGDVQIDVRAHDPSQRSFCWAASTRGTPP
jgi:hypothetical protein